MLTKTWKSPWVSLCAATVLCVTAGSLSAATIHVSPDGKDTNPGTADQPVATLRKAVFLVSEKQEACEIIFHKGVYLQGSGWVGKQEDRDKGPLPELLLTAAKNPDGSYEEVIFDGGRKIAKSEPVEGKPGVYKTPSNINLRYTAPDMWEADSRIRYELAADLKGVEQFPATFWCSGTEMFIHTTDGRPPEAHDVGMSHDREGFSVWRQNTTVRGFQFRNYFGWDWSCGPTLRAANSTIEDCHAWNCVRGFQALDGGVANMRIIRCSTDDCGGGVYLSGKHGIVEDCRFVKIRDRFMVTMYPQEDSAIEFYYNTNEGEARRNLCIGFNNGIFEKCSPVSAYIFEHNTMIGGITWGIGCTGYDPKTIIRYNIICGFASPITMPGGLVEGTVVDCNCYWLSPEHDQLQASLDLPRKFGTGEHNIVADPHFVAPASGDYRLLPDSPCLKVGPNGKYCGAFGAVGADFKNVEPPAVTVSLAPPAQRAGATGELYFERDPWQGGGRNLVRQLSAEDHPNEWLTTEPYVGLMIGAEDAGGARKPAQMKVRVGNGEWSQPEPYATFKEIPFPAGTNLLSVSLTVSNAAGNWSASKTVVVSLLNKGPMLKGKPVIYVNDSGVVVSFETDSPCLAKIEYGTDTKYGHVFEQPKDVQRSWIGSDAGDWVTVRTMPRVTNYLVLLQPAVASGWTYHYRIVLQDQLGNKTVGDDATFTVKGAAKSYFVSPQGEDADGRGAREKPWRTIQFAVDRALPGDRIILLPGVYPGEAKLTHGGLAGAPISIEAETPDSVILDGRHEAAANVRLDHASYVTITGFEIRWWAQAGVYVVDSSNVTVSHCRIWNHHWVGYPIGSGIFVHRSPDLAADHNVIYEMEQGILLLQSPRPRITYNTATMIMYAAVGYAVGSVEGAVNRDNSFCYVGNDQFSVDGNTAEQFATFDSDYNNVGTEIGAFYVKFNAENHIGIGDTEPFEIKDPFYQNRGHKAVIWLNGKRYMSLKAWQEGTGKDKHSIYKDPEYVDAEHADFRLKPGSPNIGAGENGTNIGALGVKEK